MEDFVEPWDINIEKVVVDDSKAISITVPFDLTAKDFLGFAKKALTEESVSSTVNALSNIKRAIDCIFDSLLFAVGFLDYGKQKRWTFPQKMNFLSEIGIIAPYVLARINIARNLLEHEFKKPDRRDVETAYDVLTLLYYATARFTKRFYNYLKLIIEDGRTLEVHIDKEKREITLSSGGREESVSWDAGCEGYKRWLCFVYSVLSLYV